jgi:Protein of unknown function (DUF2889)
VPDPSPTLADLRPPAGSAEHPVHRRTITMDVFRRDGHHVVIGTLHDQRPWASGDAGPRDLHVMELGIVVRRADLLIVDAAADMQTFPHAECPTIEPAFSDLIGLSVARGYTNAVQERFGRQRGCSHVEFLARALGPVVIQSVTSAAAYDMEFGSGEPIFSTSGGMPWMTNTCHLWAEDGIGMQKVALGWRPGSEYPAPSLVEIRRRLEEAAPAD